MSNEPQQNQEGFWHHVLTIPNLVSVLVGLLVFWMIADNWQSRPAPSAPPLSGACHCNRLDRMDEGRLRPPDSTR